MFVLHVETRHIEAEKRKEVEKRELQKLYLKFGIKYIFSKMIYNVTYSPDSLPQQVQKTIPNQGSQGPKKIREREPDRFFPGAAGR